MNTDTRSLVRQLRRSANVLVDRDFTFFSGQMVGASKKITRDEVLAMREAISAADKWLDSQPDRAVPDGWRPIETAPKDGTIVLVNDTTESCTPWVAASYLDGDEWAGWVYDDAISQDANPLGPQPTHWIQLPAIPQSGEQK